MPVIRVRLAGAADAALLSRLGARLFAQAFGPQNRPEDLNAYLARAFHEPVQSRELADPAMRTWIAEDDEGTAVGYAQLRLAAAPPVEAGPAPAELARIYTDARWHGRGVGVALLDACVTAARDAGASDLWLGVWQRNPRAIAFYEKHGFRVAGEQIFRVGSDDQRDWVMVRTLRVVPGADSAAGTATGRGV